MSGEESRAYRSVLAHIDAITRCLKANSDAKDALVLKYKQMKWVDVTTILDENKLVSLVLDRISNDAGQYDIFIEMLKEIAGTDLIVDKLEGRPTHFFLSLLPDPMPLCPFK